MIQTNNCSNKTAFAKVCKCTKCKMSNLGGKGQLDMNVYQSYLEFAKECLVYQDLVHKKQIPKGETYLNQIVNFDCEKGDQRSLDIVFQDFIKNYSRYVLKDTFDLGIKKSYYAIHKKVQSVLKERNIHQQKQDDTTIKLIEAYKIEKNKLFIQTKAKQLQKKRLKLQFNRLRKQKPRQSIAKRCKSSDQTFCTQVQQGPLKIEIPKLGLRQNEPRFSLGAAKTSSVFPKGKQEFGDEQLPKIQLKNSFMTLKKRNLWRSMYVSMMKKTEQKKINLR